jgi:hypothetical protein
VLFLFSAANENASCCREDFQERSQISVTAEAEVHFKLWKEFSDYGMSRKPAV